jgi:hypothetical protein
MATARRDGVDMNQAANPAHPDDLTEGWLTQRLRAAGAIGDEIVTSFSTTPIGEGVGILGVLARVQLVYEPPASNAPRSLIAKFATPHEGNRAVAMHFRLYEREVRFYQHVAPGLGPVSPRCFAAEVDPDSGDCVLLLEDLGDYRTGDQISGCSPEEARAIIDVVAPMHARYWGRTDDKALAWAPRIDGDVQIDGITAGCVAGWEPCVARFGHVMAPEILARRDRFLAAVPALHRMMARPVQTLIHGDIRLDNLMFGQQPGQRPVVALDWVVTFSAAIHDLAYLLSQNMSPEDRRGHQTRLIEYYHGSLMDQGVTGYSLKQCWDDYRVAVLYVFGYAVLIAGTLDPANERGRRLMEKLVGRASDAVMDLDLLPLLPE